MALNFDPADPQERQDQNLPPKSYADAAEEALEANGSPFNEDTIKETPPRRIARKGSIGPRPLGEVLDEEESQPSLPTTPVQSRHSQSKSFGKSWADVAEEGVKPDAHAVIDLHPDEDDNGRDVGEFTGEGLDEAPKSPVQVAHARPHRRTPSKLASQSATGAESSNGQKQKRPSTPSKPAHLKKQVAEGLNGQQQKLVYEKFESPDGKQLTSVKPDDSYEEGLRQDEKEYKEEEKKQDSKNELVSGRRAGAGWERSAYVSPSRITCCQS